MLYDPKWEVQAKPDVMSLESLIAWLETMPAKETYSYGCNGHCVLAQYFTAMGFQNVCMFGDSFWHGAHKCPGNVGQEEMLAMGKGTRLPRRFNDIAVMGDKTFGAALSRARKALAA